MIKYFSSYLGRGIFRFLIVIISVALSEVCQAQPSPVASNSGPVCIGGTVHLTESGTGGISWQWTSNGTATIVNPTDQSTDAYGVSDGEVFTVEVTDSEGKTASASTTVTVVAAPSITTQPVVSIDECLDGTTQISVAATGGTPSLNYQWYSNTTNSTTGGTVVTGATGSSYTPLSNAAGTTYYYCVVSATGDGCGTATSNTSAVTVVADPSITTQPVVSLAECIGGTTQISVAATGGTPSLNYQWYSNTTNSTTGGTIVTGATGSSYTPLSNSAGTTYYYCVVSATGDGCGTATSNTSAVTVVADPSITTQPVVSLAECIGGTTQISVAATGGTPSLNYQWYSNTTNSTTGGTVVTGATGNTYTPLSNAAGTTYYYCVVSATGDGCGTVTSNTSAVTVVADPSITTQPVVSLAECIGGTTQISVAATGGTPSLDYQWYSNTTNSTTGGTIVTGATGSSYTPLSNAAGTTYYYCVVSATGDGCGTATSNTSAVTVVADPSITTQPVVSLAECIGGTTQISVAATGGTPSLDYQWYSNTTNSTTGGTVVTGATGSSYTPLSNAAGTTYYYCVVSATGDGCGTVTSNTSAVTVVADPSITTQPVVSLAECIGGTTQISVAATGGTPSLNYQWYSNTTNSTTGGTVVTGATGSSYTPLSNSAGTTYYYCVVSATGDGCGTATSNTSAVTVVADPSITMQPVVSLAECIGGTTQISVAATGGTPSLNYQWYSNTTNSTTGGTVVTGATGSSYTPLSNSAGTTYYYCVVSATGDGCGTATSNTSAVTVVADPSITTQPVVSLAECIGGTTQISVAATGGTPSLNYQWYSNTTNSTTGGTIVTGATGSSYTPLSNTAGTTYYYCVVSATGDGCGTATSNTSAVTVVADPSITTQPVVSLAECIGGTTQISVAATGGTPSLNYQWYSNTTNSATGGTIVTGATGNTYIPLSNAAGTTYYYCVVNATGDGCGTVTSNTSAVTVVADPSITTQPVVSLAECIGGTTQISVAATGGTPSLNYQWYSNTTNSATGGTIVTGATGNTYIPLSNAAGTTYYYCVVNATGDGCGTATSNTSAVTVVADPSITTQPVVSLAECIGGTTQISVAATGGTPSLNYQWYSNTTNSTTGGTVVTGATGSSYTPLSNAAGTTYYYCVVSATGDGCGTATSNTSAVTVVADPSITTQPVVSLAECIGGTTQISVAATGGTPSLNYQWYSNTTNSTTGGTVVTGATGSSYTPLSNAAGTTYYYCVVSATGDGCGTATSNTSAVTVVADPSITTQPVVSLAECIGGTTQISVAATGGTPSLNYQWYSNTTNSTTGGTVVTGATGSSYTPLSNSAGTTYYYCMVSATGDGCGTVTSNTSAVTVVADPSITTQPVVSLAECIGGTTQISVAATGGTPSLNYQWYSNTTNSTTGGTIVTGATGSSYTPLSNSAGTTYYYCVVSATGDGCGTATSNTSAVTVVADPSITTQPVVSLAECIGGTTQISVAATGGTPSLNYQWYSNTTNSTTGGTIVTGATGSSYTPLSNSAGTTYYYCVVSATGDGCGTATSNTSAVTVVADPSITTQPVVSLAECIGGTTQISVAATGGTPSLNYQWYSNTTNSTTGGTVVTGATGSSYTPLSNTAGTTYYYCVVSATGNGCGTATSSTAAVTINTIPTAAISGTTQVCRGDPSPEITLTGANGISPYTFTYTMNGSTRTVTTTSGNNVATLLVPTNTATTYTYVLISVRDGSPSSCSQAQSGTAVVTVNPLPTATISGQTAVCEGADSPYITFTGASGTPPYTFTYTINTFPQPSISTAAGNTSVSVPVSTVNSGTFTYALVSVTDASATSCTQVQSGTALVTIYAMPAAPEIFSITPPTCSLATGSIKLSGLPSSGIWTLVRYPDLVTKTGTGSSTTISGIPAGTYTFKVTNSFGCTSPLSDEAVMPAQPITPTVVITNPGAVCSPSTVDLTLSSVTAGSTPGLTYSYWTDAAATILYSTPKAATAGTYYIKGITSAGCFDIKPVLVTVIQTPNANAGTGGNECDLTFTFNAVPSVGTGVWSKTSGPGSASFSNVSSPTATVTVSSYGTYVFTWTEINGICLSSSSVTVNFYQQPVVSAGTGGNNCGLDIYLDGTTTVGSGTWSVASGPGTAVFTPDANTADALVTVSAYGTYSFKWTATNGTCSASATVSIKFIEQPSADAGTGGDECDLDHTMNALLGTGNSGSWKFVSGPGNAVFSSLADPAATVTVDKTGTYVFSWTEINSTCKSSDHVSVVFHDLPYISAGIDKTICKGSSAQLEATGEGSFLWTPTSSLNDSTIFNPVATPSASTTFTVLLTDKYGCINKDSVDVFVWPQPVADAGPDQTLEYILHTTLEATLGEHETGTWSVISGTGTFDDNLNPATTVTELSLHSNELRWTVANNVCPASYDDVVIFVNDLKFPTLITPNGDGKNDYLVLKGLETLGKTEIVVFDRRGTVVYKNTDYNNDWNGVDMNGAPLPDDTYFVVLNAKNGKSISSYLVIRR